MGFLMVSIRNFPYFSMMHCSNGQSGLIVSNIIFIPDCPLAKNSVIPAQAGIQLIENYPTKWDNMAALTAALNVLLLDSRLRGNDETNVLFWFKNRKFNPIRTVLGLMDNLGLT